MAGLDYQPVSDRVMGHLKCWRCGLLYGSGRCGGRIHALDRADPSANAWRSLDVDGRSLRAWRRDAIIYPASNQFVVRWIPVSERGTVNGVVFSGVGAGLTPTLLAAIIAAHEWHAAF